MELNSKRFYFVDWLRVFAVLVLFPFHAGQIYNEAAFYVKDEIVSPIIIGICDFIYLWHMPLFMFLAGIGSYYSLRYRSGKNYLIERFKRLFIPLIFGTLALIPPVTYIRMFGDPHRVWHAGYSHNIVPGFDKSYFEYYPDFFKGIYPNGNFEWGHLWFLAYLLILSLIALPIFLYFKSKKGSRVLGLLGNFARKSPGIFLFFIPIAVIEVLLRRTYPNMQNLISDWANLLMFITIFIYGFIMASGDTFEEAIDRHWKAALTGGLSIAVSLSVIHVTQVDFGLHADVFYVVDMILRGIGIWFCLIGFLGFGRRFLNRGGRFIKYATEAALPIYIIHLLVVVIVGIFVVNFDLPIAVNYSIIVLLSLVSSVLLYEVAIRRFNFVRFLFGLKRKA